MEKKVVITAINMTTALGLDWQTTWENLVVGKSGVRKITLFDTTNHATKIAAQLPDEFETYAQER